MKNRKLELKDIVGYLPYDMLFAVEDFDILRMDNIYSKECTVWASLTHVDLNEHIDDINYPYLNSLKCIAHGFDVNRIKPILHPMSDLTNYIVVKGYNNDEEFIPLVELAKFDTGYEGIKYELERDPNPDYADYWVKITLDDANRSCIYYSLNSDLRYLSASLWEFDLLNQWMFDYRGLIHDGLAININTIKGLK